RFSQLVGLELKASFARHETSQAEVAEKLGHSKSGYSRWLNAKPSMPMEALLNTCELIGVDPRDVFNAAYQRLIDEMGEYSPDTATRDAVSNDDIDALADQIAADPERFHLAASIDPNKEYESTTPHD
ncbi:helix-turn-helix domain-containing protein, partial [Bifidobacterium amazonense]